MIQNMIQKYISLLVQAPEMSTYQPNSESCLLGCYNSGEMNKNFLRQVFLPETIIFKQKQILTKKEKNILFSCFLMYSPTTAPPGVLWATFPSMSWTAN